MIGKYLTHDVFQTKGQTWHELSDPILHIELRRWAHLFLIAPTSANTLAKIANGLCDNLLVCLLLRLLLTLQSNVLRAWNPHIPILLAPAMNTQMYTHPITALHLSLIKTHLPYIEVVNPIEKILACGDVGMGGMAEWGDVVGRVVRKLNLRIRPESEEDEDEDEDKAAGLLDDETRIEADNKDEDEDDEGEEEDEGIRAGGEEHEDEKRDNEVREREEEEEERQHLSRLASRVDVTKSS